MSIMDPFSKADNEFRRSTRPALVKSLEPRRPAHANLFPALLCALAPVLCYLLVQPYAEMGINDEWSYVKTAQVLAQTGHIVYNGWGSPMLGWQAYFGALFIKLLGFSFTAVRLSTVIEAMATAFLLQRTLVRVGITSRNAALATLTFVLSPLCLPLDFTFMNDVPGVFSIVLCLYMCLRALQAESESSAMTWVSLAALLNALGGTARQIAWLGVLVMVPSTLWLLRRNGRAFAAGCLSCIGGVGFVVAAMHWLARQPYSIPESAIPGRFDLKSLKFLGGVGLLGAGDLMLLALPVLLMFAGPLRSWNRRMAGVFLAGFLCFAFPAIVLFHTGKTLVWLAPFFEDYMTDSTFERLNAIVTRNAPATIAHNGLRLLLTGAVVLGILGLVACFFAGARGRPHPQRKTDCITWQSLGILLGPFSLAYIALLASRGLMFEFYDRHLLPLLAVLLLVLTRYYQERVRANLPLASAFLIIIFGAFSIAAAHDEFALYRGYAKAVGEILSSGAPATAILGPWEFIGWTEIENSGYINGPWIRVPEGAYAPQPARVLPATCDKGLIKFLSWAPAIKPVYAISLNPGECSGQIAFPPVNYRTWVAPHTNSIYAVRIPW